MDFQGYCQWKHDLGFADDKQDYFHALQLPLCPVKWSLRSGAEKYARLFAECFSKSDVVDASKAEVL